MANLDSMERIWFNRRKFEEAERKFAEHVASEHASLVVQGVGVQLDPVPSGDASPPTSSSSSSVKQQRPARAVDSIKKMTNLIGESLKSTMHIPSKPKSSPELERRVKALENEVKTLKSTIMELNKRLITLESRGVVNQADNQEGPSSEAKKAEDDDDDFDLFGSDEDNDEDSKAVQPVQPAKPAKKKPIAKSSIVLEVKPWDDETDMKEVESKVRSICTDGLLWGACEYTYSNTIQEEFNLVI